MADHWTQHPDIYKLSAGIACVNFLCIVLFLIMDESLYWVAYNAIFLCFNLIVTLMNYRLRNTRRAEIVKNKAEARRLLIERTAGY